MTGIEESNDSSFVSRNSYGEEMYRTTDTTLNGGSKEHTPLLERSLTFVPKTGLTVLTCALFIVGEMAGSGVLALPAAVVGSGWTGVGLLVVCCLISLYCGIILGKCWIILRAKVPVYRDHVRDPYPLIGFEAGGRIGRTVVHFCLLVTLFGVCVVFLLLASQNISSLINTKFGTIAVKDEFRLWILICSAILLPSTYLATPKDFWPLALGAALCTSVACILIIVKSALDLPSDLSAVDRGELSVSSFFQAFGTVAFAFGGASLFPTFQTDMKVKKDFPKAATLAFLIVLLMYLPTSIMPYLAYGKDVDSNVLRTFSTFTSHKGLATAARVLITGHLLFSLVITLNPISQQMEEFFNTPRRFGPSRIIIRTIVMLLVLAVAEAVPHFGPILNLIGGSTVTMMSFILPLLFYFKLADHIPLHVKVLHIEIIVIATMCGAISTYSAVLAIKDTF